MHIPMVVRRPSSVRTEAMISAITMVAKYSVGPKVRPMRESCGDSAATTRKAMQPAANEEIADMASAAPARPFLASG